MFCGRSHAHMPSCHCLRGLLRHCAGLQIVGVSLLQGLLLQEVISNESLPEGDWLVVVFGLNQCLFHGTLHALFQMRLHNV